MSFIHQVNSELKRKLPHQLIHKLRSNQFIRNFGWLGGSEVILRVLRLGVTVVLARFLTSEDYGLAAIVMTVGEFTRVVIDTGIHAKIIQADEDQVNELCNSAYWLCWVTFSAMFAVQCLLAFPIAWFYNNDRLILPICVSAIPYLIRPICNIQWALLNRENRLKITAIAHTLHWLSTYVFSVILAILGFGVWAIVLPGVLASPIGVYIFYTNHKWRPMVGFTTKRWREILDFAKNLLGVALLSTLRNNLDYLLVGRFLGIDQLGIYFFGFNAGLGISLSFINALNAALLPHLCAARTEWQKLKQSYFSSLKTIALVIVPLVLLQSSLAPFYVPIVFGQRWIVAIPILILICLSAIPRPFADAASNLLVTIGRPDLNLYWNILFTGIFTGAILLGVQWQALGVAIAVLIVHVVCLPLFSLWATKYTFSKMPS